MAKPVTCIMNKISVFLGNKENEVIVNFILTVTKIYKTKWNQTNISLLKIKKILKNHMELVNIYWYGKNILPKILGKWSALYNVLRTI